MPKLGMYQLRVPCGLLVLKQAKSGAIQAEIHRVQATATTTVAAEGNMSTSDCTIIHAVAPVGRIGMMLRCGQAVPQLPMQQRYMGRRFM
jgi:hypothetical protein